MLFSPNFSIPIESSSLFLKLIFDKASLLLFVIPSLKFSYYFFLNSLTYSLLNYGASQRSYSNVFDKDPNTSSFKSYSVELT